MQDALVLSSVFSSLMHAKRLIIGLVKLYKRLDNFLRMHSSTGGSAIELLP